MPALPCTITVQGLPRAVPCLRRPVPAQAGGHAYFMGNRPYSIDVTSLSLRSQ